CTVGSFAYGNAFFATVCTRLEDGVWGSRFPVVMNHLSWYRIEVDWMDQALLELETIKRELSVLPVSDVVWVVDLPEAKPPYDVGGDSEAVNLAEFFTTRNGKNLIDEIINLVTYGQQIDSRVLKSYMYGIEG
ncbi:Imm70 family immunity protein, partial [Galliscardovia ingluviei]|uniref:Imm70 family immunity protein n=1 Tax=Galliscardovia ingluviei TaxID=1769422 RepID=UPI00166F5787